MYHHGVSTDLEHDSTARHTDLMDRARLLAPQLKALGDEKRMEMVLLLAEQPRTVRELTEVTGMIQTLVSHHLAPLREQGIIEATPRGRSNVYALCCEALVAPVRLITGLPRPDAVVALTPH